MVELSIKKTSEYVGINPKDLHSIKTDNKNLYEAIILGASILSEGYIIGEVLFKLERAEVKRELAKA